MTSAKRFAMAYRKRCFGYFLDVLRDIMEEETDLFDEIDNSEFLISITHAHHFLIGMALATAGFDPDKFVVQMAQHNKEEIDRGYNYGRRYQNKPSINEVMN